jgi:hypothetical protein
MSFFTINFAVSTNEDWVDTLAIVEIPEGEDDPVPLDLEGTSFLMHIRKAATTLAIVMVLSTSNGRLIIEPDEEDVGKLTFFVPEVEMLDPGVYVHDIVWTLADGREINFAEGTLTVKLGVTRT